MGAASPPPFLLHVTDDGPTHSGRRTVGAEKQIEVTKRNINLNCVYLTLQKFY